MEGAPPDLAASDLTSPADLAMVNSSMDASMPDGLMSLPDTAMPDFSSPDLKPLTVPDLRMVMTGTPDLTMTVSPMPDLAMPDLAMPDLATPDLATPDLSLPDFAKPDFSQPDMSLPDFITLDMTDICQDNTKDGDETDVDCGGSVCASCAAGQSCIKDTDCRSGGCTSNVCDDFPQLYMLYQLELLN